MVTLIKFSTYYFYGFVSCAARSSDATMPDSPARLYCSIKHQSGKHASGTLRRPPDCDSPARWRHWARNAQPRENCVCRCASSRGFRGTGLFKLSVQKSMTQQSLFFLYPHYHVVLISSLLERLIMIGNACTWQSAGKFFFTTPS